jgi:hypothetical protein
MRGHPLDVLPLRGTAVRVAPATPHGQEARMPTTRRGVFETPGDLARTVAVALRIALGSILAFSLLSIPELIAPPPAAASSSCTGWTSKAQPPQTIRVLRTSSGRVEKVDFRRYVAEVMASGEWPSHLNTATLEAGALATKQYAWYYTLKGNHRPHYVSGGKCYDVRDDTMDQLYRPERADPTSRQWAAINKTWDLTLRKSGRFFLTGYRAGTTSACAADANGWKLYARSVNNCANQGWSSTRILNRYLSPNLTFVRSDQSGPMLAKPAIRLKAGNVLPGAATLTWRPFTSGANVARYQLQRKLGRGEWKTIRAGKATAKWADVWLKPQVQNRFRVRAIDSKGKRGPWAYSPTRNPAIRGPVGITLSGGLQPANGEPLKAKTRFNGRSIGFVTRTGPGMGKAKVFVNGKSVAIIDLERATTTDGKLVWARNWSKAKPRSVAVKAVNVGGRVDFDGFYILR